MTDIKVPELGENIESATVVKVTVSAGDPVKKDDTLVEIEAEKASIEIPSPVSGVVKEILIKENDEIKVGQVIMKVESESAEKETRAGQPADENAAASPSIRRQARAAGSQKKI
jgi:pyruvate dehydrogenase E2 component (dihydrolipoamide acetyltransferase)